MIAALDVCYAEPGTPAVHAAAAACVVFERWTDSAERASRVALLERVAPYEPGAFYRRELPCLLAALAAVGAEPEVVVIDGYVWLSADGRPGLGAHLYEALERRATIVGVAKTSFTGSAFAEHVLRGGSAKPLYVTAAGVDAPTAARWIREMNGPHRVPTLLKRADRMCRDAMR